MLGAKYLDCIYGTDRNVTTKKKRFQREDELRKLVVKVTGDPSLAKRRRVVRDTKKIGCPATIIVRDIVFFPEYLAPKDTRWFRTETSRLLREAFAKDSSSITVDRKFYVKFPDVEVHKGHALDATPECCEDGAVDVVEGVKSCEPSVEYEQSQIVDDEGVQLVSVDTSIKHITEDDGSSNNQVSSVDIYQEEDPSNIPGDESLLSNNAFFDFTGETVLNENTCCVGPELALGVQHVWKHGVDDNELRECYNRITTPGNCGFINTPPLHTHLQPHLSEHTRQEEEKNLGHQMLLAKATSPLIHTLNVLNNLQSDSVDAETIEMLKVHTESSFVCLSQLNLRLLHARKENLLASLS